MERMVVKDSETLVHPKDEKLSFSILKTSDNSPIANGALALLKPEIISKSETSISDNQ